MNQLLLPLMQAGKGLGLHDQLENDVPVSAALEASFTSLCHVLAQPGQAAAPIIFSTDNFNEPLATLMAQGDKFAEQVITHIGTPNTQICHMRLYETTEGAHWHALYARMDERGELERIIVTDSRLRQNNEGITAHRDLARNAFLQANQAKIQFIPGLPQPPRSNICWLHCLANLAALATKGEVYQRKNPSLLLGEELSNLINSLEDQALTPEGQTASDSSPIRWSFFKTSRTPNTQNEMSIWPSLSNDLVLLGSAACFIGAVALALPLPPISLPLGICLLAIGMVSLLVGTINLLHEKFLSPHASITNGEAALIPGQAR